MPQLDIDLFDDFLFFAFVSLLFGLGDEESEEGVVEMGTDLFLVHYYLETKKKLEEQRKIVKNLFAASILKQK
jgi:hypothetical protein